MQAVETANADPLASKFMHAELNPKFVHQIRWRMPMSIKALEELLSLTWTGKEDIVPERAEHEQAAITQCI